MLQVRRRRRPARRWVTRALAALLFLSALLASGPRPVAAAPPPPQAAPSFALSGRVVSFAPRGQAPNGDAVYVLTLAATLHDRRPPPQALPALGLVLVAYLESFQPQTTPRLPDLQDERRA